MEHFVTADQIVSGVGFQSDPPSYIIEQLSSILPTQGSITDFVHHNTLHAFQELDFFKAVEEAANIYGSSTESHEFFPARRGLVSGGLRRTRNLRLQVDTEEAVSSFVIRMSSAFFDQGVAATSMPNPNLGIWRSLQQLNRDSFIPLGPISHRMAQFILEKDVNEALDLLLAYLVEDKALYPRFLSEIMLSLKGWAGFCRMTESDPGMLERKRPALLTEWVALYLLAEFNALVSSAPLDVIKITKSDRDKVNAQVKYAEETQSTLRSKIEASEQSAYAPILSQLASPLTARETLKPELQAIFCIDDREFSYRGFLEKESAKIETFGAPGFFAMDFQMSEGNGKRAVKLCPPIAKTNVSIAIEHQKPKRNWLFKLFWSGGSQTLLRGWFITQLIGIPAGLHFLLSLLAPRHFSKRRLSEDEHQKSKLHLLQRDVAPRVKEDELGATQAGFSINDAALRVKNFLDTIDFPEDCAPVVAIVGHGASSANNPYFAAYDCGACSGRPGSYNARAFCEFANNSEVREVMAVMGRKVPVDTTFVPFLHDTTADHLQILVDEDKSGWTLRQKELLTELKVAMEEAAVKNAEFRCRQFNYKAAKKSARAAATHVRTRSLAWYEPRPEYNHATNVAAIVGPRYFSKSIKTDSTIFLNSYEPSKDQDGAKLVRILSAVIPVCGGINLEYFFSRIDPEVYGAGNKLPQNVVGMFGVMTGLESDLRTGLPKQMTEIHEPRRLLIVVCQRKEIVQIAIQSSVEIKQWVENGWIHMVSHDPETAAQNVWAKGQWQTWTSM